MASIKGFWTRAKIIWSIVIVLVIAGLGTVGYLYFTGQITFFAAVPEVSQKYSSIVVSPQTVIPDGKSLMKITADLRNGRNDPLPVKLRLALDLVKSCKPEVLKISGPDFSETPSRTIYTWKVSSNAFCDIAHINIKLRTSILLTQDVKVSFRPQTSTEKPYLTSTEINNVSYFNNVSWKFYREGTGQRTCVHVVVVLKDNNKIPIANWPLVAKLDPPSENLSSGSCEADQYSTINNNTIITGEADFAFYSFYTPGNTTLTISGFATAKDAHPASVKKAVRIKLKDAVKISNYLSLKDIDVTKKFVQEHKSIYVDEPEFDATVCASNVYPIYNPNVSDIPFPPILHNITIYNSKTKQIIGWDSTPDCAGLYAGEVRITPTEDIYPKGTVLIAEIEIGFKGLPIDIIYGDNVAFPHVTTYTVWGFHKITFSYI